MGLSYERRHAGLLGLHKRPSGEFSFMGLVRNIEVNVTEVASVGAGLTLLYTFTLVANTLRNNEDFLDVEISGFFANNANTKSLFFEFDGNSFIASGFGLSGGGAAAARGFKMFAKIVRVSATSVIISAAISEGVFGISAADAPTGGGLGGLSDARGQLFTVANLSSNNIDLTLEGQGTVNGDVVKNLAIVNLVQN